MLNIDGFNIYMEDNMLNITKGDIKRVYIYEYRIYPIMSKLLQFAEETQELREKIETILIKETYGFYIPCGSITFIVNEIMNVLKGGKKQCQK